MATVYNLRVADYHTYFVGSREWGFSVWAHHANYEVKAIGGGKFGIFEDGKPIVDKGLAVQRYSPVLRGEGSSAVLLTTWLKWKDPLLI